MLANDNERYPRCLARMMPPIRLRVIAPRAARRQPHAIELGPRLTSAVRWRGLTPMHRRALLAALLASFASLAGCADAPAVAAAEPSPARRGELILEGGGRASSAVTRLI